MKQYQAEGIVDELTKQLFKSVKMEFHKQKERNSMENTLNKQKEHNHLNYKIFNNLNLKSKKKTKNERFIKLKLKTENYLKENRDVQQLKVKLMKIEVNSIREQKGHQKELQNKNLN